MEGAPQSSKVLPENAFRELKEGEQYHPVVPPDQSPPEVTARSVGWGIFMVVLFTFAAAYIGLKTGNVIETSIPIAILAVFLGNFYSRRNSLLENVIIQSMGQASGVVVAGAIFTIPALYILNVPRSFLQIFLSCLLGGFLGVVLLIPLRRYFCKELHGQLPFPEGTAITNVLATGERSKGAAGKVLVWAFGLGFVYDFIVEFLHLWNAHLASTQLFGRAGQFLADKRIEIRLNATAVYFGLGYIIGPRYAGIIAAGSVLSYLVLVPLVYFAGVGLETPLTPPDTEGVLVRDMAAGDIFQKYVRPLGIGCIATAGFIGIIKMGKIILSSLSLAFMSLTGKGGAGEEERTDRDMSPRNVFLIQIGAIVAMFFLFWYISASPAAAVVGTLVTYVLAFLFTPVAARAIAIVGVNPVSGMTMITLIIACLILANTGLLGGELGMSVALIVGCAVCTALATSGAFITDLKVGYWLGASPFQQERWKYLGILVASLCVGLVIAVLAESNGFLPVDPVTGAINKDPLPAPQGNLMATIVQSVMGGEEQPILLFALGGLIAIMLEMAAVAGLAFGLGMYLPIEINLAIFAGALVGHFIGNSGRDEKEKAARRDQGTLVASGLMAGAAIIGVIGSIFKLKMLPEGFKFQEPMNYVDFVEHSLLGDGSFNAYFEGFGGMFVSVLGAALLIFGCYRLAVWGGRMQMEEEREAGE